MLLHSLLGYFMIFCSFVCSISFFGFACVHKILDPKFLSTFFKSVVTIPNSYFKQIFTFRKLRSCRK
jgi:hypothetical protein